MRLSAAGYILAVTNAEHEAALPPGVDLDNRVLGVTRGLPT